MKRCKDCNRIIWPWSLQYDGLCSLCKISSQHKEMIANFDEINRLLANANVELNRQIAEKEELLRKMKEVLK